LNSSPDERVKAKRLGAAARGNSVVRVETRERAEGSGEVRLDRPLEAK
jgi:hypothetical protein